ncbi:hypothetical protein [Streptomyces salinarius]|uniref:hypothetical protein n=1 Tax=Streptomyces salinarius TaxID=2762598 RepID=UPI002852CC6B|nr:hypothetical protein [Streptomyces salinarius]
MGVHDIGEEFRAGYREGAARGSAADELRALGAWLRRLPGGLARFLGAQLRALWTLSVCFLRDALRGTPVLLGAILRGIARGVRAAASRSAGAGGAAPATSPVAKPEPEEKAPAADGERQEEAQLAEGAPAGPPWKKLRKAPAKAVPAKQGPAPGPAGKSLGDLAETAGIGFLILVLVATFGGMLLGALGDLLAPYARGIALVLVVVWCVAAVIVAPRDEAPGDEDQEPGEDDVVEEDLSANDHEESAGEEDQKADPWPAQREAIRAFVEAEVAAGNAGHRDAKGKGAPVDALLAELQRRGSARGWERNAMLDLLERAGITVREQMKFRIGGKQKTPPGVHVDDLANDLGFRPRLPTHLVPDLTPPPGPSREAEIHLG